MGEAAGRNMAGAGRRYDHLPFFYSDLFELGYEAVGDVSSRHQTVADWKEKFRRAWSTTSRTGGCGACCCGMSGTRWMRPGR